LTPERYLAHLVDEYARTRHYAGAFTAAALDVPAAPDMMTGRELILHLMGCDHWLLRAIAHDDADFANFRVTESFADGAAAVPIFDGYYRRLRDAVASMSAEHFGAPFRAFGRDSTRADLCLELLLHECHHRGQLACALHAAGITPPDLFKGPLPKPE
jgi:uncharacterized damage-inducible protein DinB